MTEPISGNLTTEPALETELNIDPDRFETVFSQVWGDDQDPDDRVHIVTEVESEILRVADEWVQQVHETAEAGGRPDGLFLIIQGAEATGKTTMTRYIKNSLSPIENPERRDIPLTIPVWDNIDPNQTPYKYRDMLKNEGRRVFEDVDFVPDIDGKIEALNAMSAEMPEEQVQSLSEEWDVTPEAVRGILGTQQSGGDRSPKDVVSNLAEEGYINLFIFDEMVSASDKERAQSALKWFKDHLYPYVGLVLFCHPDVSDAIQREMRDQARRRNLDATLDIAGETYDLKEDIVIDIRGKQNQIIDLERLLHDYFEEVTLDGEDQYGLFNEENIAWMKSLLESGGLIGNLIDAVKPTVKEYARYMAEGGDQKEIGVFLFDNCNRMEHVRIHERLKNYSELNPRDDEPLVWRAKELVTGSVDVDELEEDIRGSLRESRVLIEDSDSDDFVINPRLLNYGSVERQTDRPSERSRDDILVVYEETLLSYDDKKTDPDEKEELRRNIEIGVSSLLSHLNSRRVNISNRGGLALPGQSRAPTDYMELSSAGTTGRANKIQISDGEYADYDYSFLTYAVFDDESLTSPDVQDTITDLYDGENGILILTDQDSNEIDTPDWFEEEIDRQHWSDPAFNWGDITEIVNIDDLSDIYAVYQHITDRGLEEDSEVLAEIERLDNVPETSQLYEMLDRMYNDIAINIQDIHAKIYEKYEGPILSEVEAFNEVLDEVQERGFVSESDLETHYEEYGYEIQSLKDKDAIIEVDDDAEEADSESNTVVFLKEDFGSASKLGSRNVSGPDDLFPVSSVVMDNLSEFRAMEEDRIAYGDDDIESALAELETKEDWVDHFLFEENAIKKLEDAIDESDVDVFSDVLEGIDQARETEEEDYESVVSILEDDRNLWDRISDLDVETSISPIHRALFYARLHKEPPAWAEEYLKSETDYPDLLYETREQIDTILESLDETREDVESGFSEESETFDDLCGDLAEFMGVEFGNDNVELSNSNVDQLNEKELDELRDIDFESRVEAIAENERKRKNLNNATLLLGDAQSAVEDDFEDELEVDSLDEIDSSIAEEFLPTGKAIAKRLIEEDVVFKDTDEPKMVVSEFEQFCEVLTALVQDAAKKDILEDRLEDQWDRIEHIPGDSIEDRESYLAEKESDLEEAERLLKLKDGHCDLCRTEWENLTDERQSEISNNIDEIESEYEISLTLANIEDFIEEVSDDRETLDDADGLISTIMEDLSGIDLEEHREKLRDLKEKYEPEE